MINLFWKKPKIYITVITDSGNYKIKIKSIKEAKKTVKKAFKNPIENPRTEFIAIKEGLFRADTIQGFLIEEK